VNKKHGYVKTKYWVRFHPPHTDYVIPCMRNPNALAYCQKCR